MKIFKVVAIWMAIGSLAYSIDVAFVDAQKVFDAHPKTKEAKELLNKEIEEKNEEIKVMEEEILSLKEELTQPISEDARRRKEALIRVKIEKLERFHKETLSAIEEKRRELEEEINVEIYDAIKAVAEERGIDLVLDKNSILYGKPGFDITEDVIKSFEKNEAE
jgi:outer membrane protein